MNENELTLQISVNDLQEELKELLVAAVLTKVDVLNGVMDLPEEAGSIEEVDQDIKDFAIMFRNVGMDVPISEWSETQQYKLQTITMLKKLKEMGVL